ncbi:MAG TPA: hypothetical protein VE959_24935 [Bryobacteraceae bacterium]|nr:hypothetical protein [Bryobacteraceae bacterium]
MKHIIAILFFGTLAVAQQGPAVGGCPAFPVTNVWNVAVNTLLVHTNSANIMAKIGTATDHFHLDDVIPINFVPGTQPLVPVAGLAYGYGPDGGGSDPGLWPIPSTVLIESGSDGHALIVDTTNCLLYEIFALSGGPGAWSGGSAAKWDLNSNALRPDGGTSADAAGLPMTPGILRYSDITAGSLNHALRISVPTTQYGSYTWPARHYASSTNDPNLPMMGQRLRLKASFDVSGFSATNQIILRGLQKYGVLVADNGMAWGMQHDQDGRWNANDLLALHNILGSNMEVVDESGLMSGPDSGMAVMPPPPGVFVSDAFGRQNSVPFGPGISIVNGVITATGSGGSSSVLSVAGRTGNVTLAISDVTGLQGALDAKQPLLSYTPEQALTFVSPLTRSGGTISCPTCSVNGGSGGGGSTLTVTPVSLAFSATANGSAPASQTLTVTAATQTTFSASASSTGGGGNWLSISPSGTLVTNQPITVSVALTGLSAGTYSGTVALTANSVTTSVAVTLTVSANTGPPSGAASFLKIDTTTAGTWKGVYGADGYNVINDTVSYPSYATVTPSGNLAYTWISSTSDGRALQKASSTTDRIAACWYTGTSFTIDLKFSDTNTHQVALYLMDWDNGGRSERVDILDANNNVLDTRTVSGFTASQYLVWNLSGHVVARITNTGSTAVLSGIFFDSASTATTPSVVSVTPNSGTGTNSSQTFTFVYNSPKGYLAIVSMQILINKPQLAAGGCYLLYNRANNVIYLTNDAGTAWQTPVTLGQSGTLQNSQCTVNTASSSVSGSGNNLTLILSLTFKATFVGLKNIYSDVTDGSDSNWQQVGSWTLPSAGTPTVGSVTPSTGTGSSQTFGFVFSDPNGYSAIASTQILVNNALVAVSGCYLLYNRASNALYLTNDGGTAWQTPVTLGQSGSLQNSQCSVDTVNSSASGNGNNLTLNLALTFKAGFSGTKNVYSEVYDGTDSGWQQRGSWVTP